MDDGLKQRLVGAGVVCAVAVILLPGLFQRTDRRVLDRSTLIPAAPVVAPVTPVAPVKPDVMAPLPAPEQVFELDPEANLSSAEPEAPGLAESGLAKAWVLQVASFTEASRANDLQQRLVEMDYKAFVQAADTPAGKRYRVYVGPHVDKARTQSIKAAVDRALGVNGLVLNYHP